MEKYIVVMRETSGLMETVQEALAHTQTLLKQGKGEASITLFSDIVQAFSSMEQSVLQLPEIFVNDDVASLTEDVRNALNKAVESYEAKAYTHVQEVLQSALLPAFNKWSEVLEKNFRPYVIS